MTNIPAYITITHNPVCVDWAVIAVCACWSQTVGHSGPKHNIFVTFIPFLLYSASYFTSLKCFFPQNMGMNEFLDENLNVSKCANTKLSFCRNFVIISFILASLFVFSYILFCTHEVVNAWPWCVCVMTRRSQTMRYLVKTIKKNASTTYSIPKQDIKKMRSKPNLWPLYNK